MRAASVSIAPSPTAAKDLAIRERTAINLKLQELTHGTITSVDQTKRFLDAINARGHNMTTLNKRAVAQVLASKPDDYVRQLLELRRTGARAAVNKFKRMLAYASPVDDRMRGTLAHVWRRSRTLGRARAAAAEPEEEREQPAAVGGRFHPRRRSHRHRPIWQSARAARRRLARSALRRRGHGAQIRRLLRRRKRRAGVVGRRTLEARRLSGLTSETGDTTLEPYRVIARKMLHKAGGRRDQHARNASSAKAAELASGFGGSVGAWRRIVPHDPRTDDEIKAIIQQWRDAHPAICKFWKDLARAIRVAIRTGQPILVAPPPQPPIVAAFADGNLTLTLPSGRAITYPEARLVPGKFEDAPPDVQFMDNARGQWKPYRGWFGTFVENVVQGTRQRSARRGDRALRDPRHRRRVPLPRRGHGRGSDRLALRRRIPGDPAEAASLGDRIAARRQGAFRAALSRSRRSIRPSRWSTPNPDDAVLEQAVDSYIDDTREDLGPIDDPALVEREDDEDFVANLADNVAPLTELVSLPLTPDNKVACPFHDDVEPSCTIYPDHFHCFGCGEHGSRLDWLMRVEGMTEAEAVAYIKDWPGPPTPAPQNGDDDAEKLAFIKSIWTSAQPLLGSIAERYLDETRDIDITRLPEDIHRSLRFHPNCVFGPGTHLPCLIALMRDPLTDEPVGIQRIALEHRDGKIEKIDRRMLGHAGVVKLWPAGSQLVVGEGLETVLAAATRIPYRGASAARRPGRRSPATRSRSLPVIPGVERLIILVDHDDAGEAGGRAPARRAGPAPGAPSSGSRPTRQGADFNDLVLERTP